ncbi:hypothetical protein ASF11_18070 [Acidovorax sp. Leaf76]|uniref:hypothetical protein n=1 Tax=unclassified Acidovorax TaxID=2684926 RepID=UPI0006FEF7D6|nr:MULTISPECIES: hypothetical protein [unclassified Acidovorax]KQO25903.1 hypothetical protein ASF11_18070 [Acidovorax sp. Leaf76]KQO28752.1 hypothetical protein ASF19_17305 [Acidovorax sp. Leaf84]KQS40685.1 hypothetical protein ASG27_21715 [Acidovorax sp. Leaf191]
MKPNPFWSLWGWPIVMGVLTTTGLITALVSDTWGDWWSWVGLGVPVAVMGWFSWPFSQQAHHARRALRDTPAPQATPGRAGDPVDTDIHSSGTDSAPR